MTDAPATPAVDPLAEAHRQALAELRVMGMEIARGLHAQTQQPDADLGEAATKFARVARAVRQTIALEARLAEITRRGFEAPADGAPGRLSAADVTSAGRVERAEKRQRLAENKLEAVTLIRRAANKVPGLDRERFDERLDERLDADPYDEHFRVDRDLTKTIAGICRDLGLEPDWKGLSALDWRQVSRETRAALTGEAIETFPHAMHQRFPPHTLPERTMPRAAWWDLPPEQRPFPHTRARSGFTPPGCEPGGSP